MEEKKNEDRVNIETEEAGAGAANANPNVRWEGSNMKSTYANVCNVTSTMEEVALLFGTNQNWDAIKNELTVELSNRIIMTPHAVKRLSLILSNVIEKYEARFGVMNISSR